MGWKLREFLGPGMKVSLYGSRVLVDPGAVDGLDLGACLLGDRDYLFTEFFVVFFAVQGHEGITARNGPGKLPCLIYYSLTSDLYCGIRRCYCCLTACSKCNLSSNLWMVLITVMYESTTIWGLHIVLLKFSFL